MSTDNSEFSLWPAIVYVSLALIFIALTIVLYWPLAKLAFLSDNSPVSWFSSAQLWALVVLAMRLNTERVLPVALGAWLTLAMLILAFDEQFMLHEHWKYGCIDWIDICQYRVITEMPMILIGVAGVYTAYRLHMILYHRNARLILWAAISIGAIAIGLDLFGGPQSLLFMEEGLEVVAEALFIGVLLGWRKPRNETGVAILSD